MARFALALLPVLLTACLDGPLEGGNPPALSLPAPNSTAGLWLQRHSIPFQHTHLSADLNELEPLRQIIGNARVVALGEATHGTREFFEMKARMLRFLVERMGFNAFVIEANWPEGNRLDRYVRTGIGDPAELLSGLYFWTWNTQEVAEMIQWMRAHNAAGGNVGFYGNDMQFVGMAIDNVRKYVAKVDAAALPEINERLSCLAVYANGPNGVSPTPGYNALAVHDRNNCYDQLKLARDFIANRQAAYTPRSSGSEFATGLQSARVVIQYEESASGRRSRDAAMAENTRWLLDQLGPNSNIVV